MATTKAYIVKHACMRHRNYIRAMKPATAAATMAGPQLIDRDAPETVTGAGVVVGLTGAAEEVTSTGGGGAAVTVT